VVRIVVWPKSLVPTSTQEWLGDPRIVDKVFLEKHVRDLGLNLKRRDFMRSNMT
jgi:hypothetical protein